MEEYHLYDVRISYNITCIDLVPRYCPRRPIWMMDLQGACSESYKDEGVCSFILTIVECPN
ncbi:hypothetical protein CR513_44551, partial [Mucuna pruriens]